ncbi:MAG: hypothetical protein CL916_09665 [Deltaproteobacteria bacterium]|nr:hypothetical protein [Deltaproteobacteria bacterium]
MFFFALMSQALPCAYLLTTDQGALAVSDAQEVILEANNAGVRTSYRIQYEGDAESFGWLVVVRGTVGEGDVTETDESIFDTLRDKSQPRLIKTQMQSGGSGIGCGETASKSMGDFSSDESLNVEVTAQGFAGPFAYQVLSAESGDALSTWLDSEGFELGDTEQTIDEYISEGGYSFVAVTLTPEDSQTPQDGRILPALSIQSDATELHFPARMATSSMAEKQRTTVFVLGENTANVQSGWNMTDNSYIDSQGEDPVVAFEDVLLTEGSAEVPAYWRTYSSAHDGVWLTRFDTLAPRVVHTIDPLFGFEDAQYDIETQIEVYENDSGAMWLLVPLLGLGLVRRRRD